MDIVNLLELEAAAQKIMEQSAFDYYVSGAEDEITVLENSAAFSKLRLHYRVLRGQNTRSLATEILGHKLSMPLLIAPSAFHKLAHPDGELATVRASHAAGTIMTLSTMATSSLEEVRAASPNAALWFQLYLFNDEAINLELVRRAEAVGAGALVLTVDTPVLGRRERDIRNRFSLPPHLQLGNLPSELLSYDQRSADGQPVGSRLTSYVNSKTKANLGWDDVAWLRGVTNLPILLKGVCHPEDARLGLERGVAGIWVSNHGGRQLDTSPATIEVLPRIADVVAGAVPIVLDGGVRRGTDVVKALALGATAVALGRPVLWALALGGQAGVTHALELLRAEIDVALALCGYDDVTRIPRELVQ